MRQQQLARRIPDHHFTARRHRNHARHQLVAISARNDSRPRKIHEGHQAVGGPEVDADDVACGGEVDFHGLGGRD